ncbi:MAG TPA: NAD(P)/FAD-dependent oxidoreductase [Solirubrobacterales bacterium]|nr:NAD(P)/FAD-dependent oxidoreductase [Solirubrobacterales bacterium]
MRDAVIVGGGHNGLVCAAYLARAGLDVEVVERCDLLGGAAVTEEPWPGYRVSSASYVVSLMPPEIERELDLGSHGYRVSIISPDYFVPFPDGNALTLWGDTGRDAREIARLSPADAEAYAEFDAHFDRVTALLKELMFVVPPNLTAGDLPRWLSLAARVRRWSGRDVAEIVRLFTLSAADFLDEWFTDERVKGALATQALVGNWGGPMTPGSAYVLMHHWVGEVDGHPGAWGWVHGGMGGVTGALASAARAAGASIRTDSPVRRVTIRDGAATGVELEDGETIAARRVISNAHPVTTYLELIGEQHLPDDVVRDVRRFRTRSGSVKVNVALSAIPDAPAWPRAAAADFRRGLVAVAPSIEYLERAWDDAKYGRPAERPYVEAVFPTVHEPELAPDGRQLMLAFVQYAPYRLAQGTWDEAREPFGSRVIDVVGEHLPGLADAAEHVEVLAPPDLERRFGLVGGNIMQGEMTPDQSFSLRPIFGYADYTTPVRGLHLCGAGTHPGGGVMGVPGRNCARVVARAARRERRAAPLGRLRRRG